MGRETYLYGMHGASPTPIAPSTLRYVALAIYVLVNVPLVGYVVGLAPVDWRVLADAPAAFFRGDLYRPADVPFLWSPVSALLMVIIAPIGFYGWAALHVAALGLLRDRGLILLAAVSAGLWADLALGNTLVFVFVFGVLALRGSRFGSIAYIVLCALMPRPLQLPLLIWLLWQRPQLRIPATAIFIAHAGLVIATGYGAEWLGALMTTADQQIAAGPNWGPTGLIGAAWLVAGVPLAVLLTRHGLVGLAGLAMSPYLFPQYLLLALVDVETLARAVRQLRSLRAGARVAHQAQARLGRDGPGATPEAAAPLR